MAVPNCACVDVCVCTCVPDDITCLSILGIFLLSKKAHNGLVIVQQRDTSAVYQLLCRTETRLCSLVVISPSQ